MVVVVAVVVVTVTPSPIVAIGVTVTVKRNIVRLRIQVRVVPIRTHVFTYSNMDLASAGEGVKSANMPANATTGTASLLGSDFLHPPPLNLMRGPLTPT
jgi:hypothetical protein